MKVVFCTDTWSVNLLRPFVVCRECDADVEWTETAIPDSANVILDGECTKCQHQSSAQVSKELAAALAWKLEPA